MKKIIFLIIALFLVNLSFAQKQKLKASAIPKEPNTLDTRKNDFPDLVSDVKIGKLADNITIEAIDGSFVLKPGEQFKPKSYTLGYSKPNKDLYKRFKNSEGTKVRIKYGYEVDDPDFVPEKDSKEAPKKIKKTADLYGIIEFNKVWDACSDLPVARTYFINIPESSFQAALGGSISVYYEVYDCTVPFPEEKPSKTQYTSLVIFLSDIEF
ncbi:MAG: hypothetical protein KDC90_08780 [Ignavibacteriae bacterium]|nr:hypothetical protein [Ignavibacteriota bacterium]